METEALTRIAEAIEKGILPYCISIVGAIGPLILTGLSMLLTFLIYKQNTELKKELYNRDVVNQTRTIIINSYDSFSQAIYVTSQINNGLSTVFMSQEGYLALSKTMENVCKDLIQSYGQLNIILNDKEMVDYLTQCVTAFTTLNHELNNYINSPTPSQVIQYAWTSIQQKYPSVVLSNYYFLNQNPSICEEFKKMCDNSYTNNIQSKITIFQNLIQDEKFDNYFRSHIQIQKIN